MNYISSTWLLITQLTKWKSFFVSTISNAFILKLEVIKKYYKNDASLF